MTSETTKPRNRRWAENRANRLNKQRLAALLLFANTTALEIVAPTITTDDMVRWEAERVEATNAKEASDRRYWENRYWTLMADAADTLPEYERVIMMETFEKRYGLDASLPNYRSHLAFRCDILNNTLCAAEVAGYIADRTPAAREHCKTGRARSIETFFFIAMHEARRSAANKA